MSLRVYSTQTMRSDVAEVLRQTIYGLPGKLRYRQLDAADKCAKLPNTRWLLLEKNGKLLGNAAMLERTCGVGGQRVSTAYVRYLSVPAGPQSSKTRPSNNKQNHLRQLLAAELSTAPKPHHTLPRVLFAYVEADNTPSQQLCASFGLKSYRQLGTFMSSRLNPKIHPRFRALQLGERRDMQVKLEFFYSGYHFFFSDELFGHGTYYVITNEHDEPVVGGLVFQSDWEIVEIPGIEGWLVKNLFPRLPGLKKLLPRNKLSYAAMEGVWFTPGYEHLLEDLFASCAARLGLHVSIFWDDAASKVFAAVQKNVKPGIIGHLNKVVKADILMRTWQFSPAMETALRNKPAYVSAHDLT